MEPRKELDLEAVLLQQAAMFTTCGLRRLFLLISFLQFVFTMLVAYYMLVDTSPGKDEIKAAREQFMASANRLGAPLLFGNSSGQEIPYSYKKWRNSEKLPRSLEQAEHQAFFEIINKFITDANRDGLNYVLWDGTLLGSFIFHDFIPWDDDFDVIADAEQLIYFLLPYARGERELLITATTVIGDPTIAALDQCLQIMDNMVIFEKLCEFRFYLDSVGQWPFVELRPYFTNSTHTWSYYEGGGKIISTSEKFEPFHLRPFGTLWIPAPHKTAHILRQRYREFRCETGRWDHKEFQRKTTISVKCRTLANYYPFVRRRSSPMGMTEYLRLGTEVLHVAVVDEDDSTKFMSLEI